MEHMAPLPEPWPGCPRCGEVELFTDARVCGRCGATFAGGAASVPSGAAGVSPSAGGASSYDTVADQVRLDDPDAVWSSADEIDGSGYSRAGALEWAEGEAYAKRLEGVRDPRWWRWSGAGCLGVLTVGGALLGSWLLVGHGWPLV